MGAENLLDVGFEVVLALEDLTISTTLDSTIAVELGHVRGLDLFEDVLRGDTYFKLEALDHILQVATCIGNANHVALFRILDGNLEAFANDHVEIFI